MQHFIKLSSVVLLSFFPILSFAQLDLSTLTKPESAGLSSDTLEEMNRYLHNLVDEKQLAGIQTAVITKKKLLHFDTYGHGRIEDNKLLDEASIFRIFSMTKPIVSVALMQLYEKGKFKLEDPLYKFMPEFKEMYVYDDSILKPATNPIKIVDLLRHTAGFSYGRSPYSGLDQFYTDADLYASTSNKEFVKKLSKIPLQFEPGTNWQYGLSTNICGYLIEVLSGKSLDVYLKEHVLDPLGMKDTHFQVPEDKIENFTDGYGWHAEEGLNLIEAYNDNRYVQEVTLFNAGGGLVSTTLDYLKFCQMLLNKGKAKKHRILKARTIRLMLSDHMEDVRAYQERFRFPLGEASFGLGFSIRGSSPDKLEKVYGWGGAVGTYFKIDTQNKLAYVLMIQLSPYRQLGLRETFQHYINASLVG